MAPCFGGTLVQANFRATSQRVTYEARLTMSAQEQQDWYYASANGERLGPVSIRELSSLAGQGLVELKTLVWSPGYSDWIPAAEIADLLKGAPAGVAAPVATVATSVLPQNLKPRKGSFVFPRVIIGLLVAGLIGAATAVMLGLFEVSPWLALAMFAAVGTLSVFASLVAYRKERYEIHDSRVICHRGGLMSDQTTELEVRNITHVKLKLPWLRHKFFGVGDVVVETAGNSKPVVLRVIEEPQAVYAGLRERMRRHGYALTQQQLLHEEQPALIGIIGECIGLLVGLIMAGLYVLPGLVAMLEIANAPAAKLVVFGLCGVAVLLPVALIILRFLDLRRRTYRVYNDVVVYEEGFLTRHHAFIPYENIADANTKSSFFDRIFSLYDVQVSCQGSGAEIKFRRLRHGVALSRAIDELVVLASQKKKPAARSAAENTESVAQSRPRRAEPAAMPRGEMLVADLRMHAGRTIVPLLLLLPLFPIWIAAMIQTGVRLMSTHYAVRPGSLRHSYRFLTLHDREFVYEKITGLVIKQNLWDRMFGTMTLRFWSIGSGQPLEFAHVHGSQFDLAALMRQVGIPQASPEPYQVDASFGVVTWLRASLKFLPLVLFFAALSIFAATQLHEGFYYLFVAPVLIGMGACFYTKLYAARQRLRFHEHHIEAEQGVISRRRYYARYSNVRRSKVTRYPGGEAGSLEIFVAGEEEIRQPIQQKESQKRYLKPCSFTSGFLPGVRDQGLLLDDILCGRIEPAPQAVAAEPLEVLLEAPRAVGNALVRLVLLSVFALPLSVLLPLTIPLTVMRVKRWRYRIERARIVVRWGMLYRSETSILLDRVDSLQQSQGPLNKLFKNGNVSIMTAGSSKPDLNLIDSPAYLAMYEAIREQSTMA